MCIVVACECRTCVSTLQGHTDAVIGCDILEEQLMAVSCAGDKTIRLWDLQTGECVETLRGHLAGVFAVRMTKNRIISGSLDKTIRIWKRLTPRTSRPSRTLRGHTSAVCDVRVDEKTNRIISGSWDGSMKIWDLNSGVCVNTIRGKKYCRKEERKERKES